MPVKNLLKTLCDRFDRVESSGGGWIRYASGMQVIWGQNVIESEGASTLTFPIPFASIDYQIFFTAVGLENRPTTVSFDRQSTTVCTARSSLRYGYAWVAVGHWK